MLFLSRDGGELPEESVFEGTKASTQTQTVKPLSSFSFQG
jgi:hypothetical protein